jgi:hypothetical protein
MPLGRDRTRVMKVHDLLLESHAGGIERPMMVALGEFRASLNRKWRSWFHSEGLECYIAVTALTTNIG